VLEAGAWPGSRQKSWNNSEVPDNGTESPQHHPKYNNGDFPHISDEGPTEI
jgi:hypothetical protein